MVASTGCNFATVSGRDAKHFPLVRQSPKADSHRRARHPSHSRKTDLVVFTARILVYLRPQASRLTNDPFAHRSSSSTPCSAVPTRAFSKGLSTSSTAAISSDRKSIHHAHRQVNPQAQCVPQPGAREWLFVGIQQVQPFRSFPPPHTYVYLRASLEKSFHTNLVRKYMSVAIYRVSV